MNNIKCAKQEIRATIAGSMMPEDPRHAEDTLEWVLKFDPNADEALQLAALSHDIDRAVEEHKVQRCDYDEYDDFKDAHAKHGAKILREILDACGVAEDIIQEACRLVRVHEVGGDSRSDLLNDADSISYFSVNMPFYYKREGWTETKRRCSWGYRRLSVKGKKIVKAMTFENEALACLLKEAIQDANLLD